MTATYTFDLAQRDQTIAPMPGGIHFGGPPLAPGSSHDMQTQISDGSCLVNGTVYAVKRGGTQSRIWKWTDPTDPGSFVFSDSPFGFFNAEICIHDPANNRIIVGPYIAGGIQPLLFVKTVDPVTLEWSDFIEGAELPCKGRVGVNSGMCVDADHLYLLTFSLDENSWVFKFRLADGTLVGQRQLGNAGLRSTAEGDVIETRAGFLYVAGGEGWTGRLPADLSSEVMLDVDPGTTITTDDDGVIIADSFWIGDETRPVVYKVSGDMSAAQKFPTGAGQGQDGFWFDGRWLWVGHSGTPSRFVAMDPTTGEVVRTHTLNVGENKLNELFRLPGGMFLLTLQVLGKAIWKPMAFVDETDSIQIHRFDAAGGDQAGWLAGVQPGSRLRLSLNPSRYAVYRVTGRTDHPDFTDFSVEFDSATVPDFADGETVTVTTDAQVPISGLLKQAQDELWDSAVFKKWKTANRGECAKIDAYWRDGGTPPSGIKTMFGLAYLHEGMAYRASLSQLN